MGLSRITYPGCKNMRVIRKIWLCIYFRVFVVLTGLWIFPFVFLGLNKTIACLLYLGMFWWAVFDNDGVWP